MLPFQGSQRPFLIDMEQVMVSTSNASVTVAPYALPVCVTQHHIPVCTGATAMPPVSVHATVAQPTWSIPPCSVHVPTCGMQHLPPCISHQVPLAQALAPHITVAQVPSSLPPLPPHFHHHHHDHHRHDRRHHHHHHQSSSSILPQQHSQNHAVHSSSSQNLPVYQTVHHAHQNTHHNHHHQHQLPLQPSQPQQSAPPAALPSISASQHHRVFGQNHVSPTTHYLPAVTTLRRIQEESVVEPRFPYLNIPHLATQQSTRHQPPPPPPPPPPQPILLHDHVVHAIPHELLGTLSRYRRVSSTRQRWRTVHPPPPYPGFLLHFLAMLGRPPLTQYRMNLHNLHEDGPDLDNYEALLNLADRLGEAKPRGLTRCDIDLLPCYRFNQEIRRSLLDQSSCVICMCDFESRQLLRALPCFHEFHARCVDKWLKTNRTCPICRADASERQKAECE